MPIIPALEVRDPSDHDARFIGLAAALKSYVAHGVVDGGKVSGYIDELCPDDLALRAKSMAVAQWVGGRTKF